MIPKDPRNSEGEKGMVEDRRRQSADAVSRLLESAAAVDPSGVPPKVRARAALVLCDDLAAMVAASGERRAARPRSPPRVKLLPLRAQAARQPSSPRASRGLAHRKGSIAPALGADLAVVDLNAEWRVERSAVASSAGYSIYDGWKLKGRVVHTLVRGRPVLREGRLDERAIGTGSYMRRALR